MKRILRGPIFWIALAVGFVLLGSSFISGIGAPEEIDTSEAVAAITSNDVDTATIIDRDQILELTLKDGSQVRSTYVTGQGVELQTLLQSRARCGPFPRCP